MKFSKIVIRSGDGAHRVIIDEYGNDVRVRYRAEISDGINRTSKPMGIYNTSDPIEASTIPEDIVDFLYDQYCETEQESALKRVRQAIEFVANS